MHSNPLIPANAGTQMTERDFSWLAAPLFDLGPGIRRDERKYKA